MDTPLAAWLILLVMVFGLAGCYIFNVMFAHELAERLVAHGPRGYASLVTGATAVLAGIGTALITASLEVGNPWYGLVLGTLAGAGWSALALKQRSRNGGHWLSRTRSRLRRHLDPRHRPADLAHVMAQVRRIERTGVRLTDRADGLTVRSWAARPARRDLLTAAVWLSTSAVMGVLVLVRFMGVTVPDITDLAAMAILGLSFLAGPAAMLLRRDNRRWRLRRIGTELTDDARRAAVALAAQR
ncbi:hypothetical protein GCM10010191_90160 [Actinomadura vinacea]|uniref:Uncharacterized protein n=1 Tax=Actinomadura vinacea TaxID=115336 RepID=A0ABP5XJD9_9ACTN